MKPPLTLVKIGGALAGDEKALETFWKGIAQLQQEGPAAVVHGGGPQATSMAHRLGHTPRIINGRRVTTELDLDIIHWTLRGQLNTLLVRYALQAGIQAVGLSGADAAMVEVTRRPPWEINGEEVDFGWVGDIVNIQPSLLKLLMENGYTPVIATLGIDANRHTFNVNGDTVACSLAEALGASRFIMVTEAGGVRRHAGDPASHLKTLSRASCETGQQEGWITDGMIVKLNVGFEALKRGIDAVYITAPNQLDQPQKGTQLIP